MDKLNVVNFYWEGSDVIASFTQITYLKGIQSKKVTQNRKINLERAHFYPKKIASDMKDDTYTSGSRQIAIYRK